MCCRHQAAHHGCTHIRPLCDDKGFIQHIWVGHCAMGALEHESTLCAGSAVRWAADFKWWFIFNILGWVFPSSVKWFSSISSGYLMDTRFYFDNIFSYIPHLDLYTLPTTNRAFHLLYYITYLISCLDVSIFNDQVFSGWARLHDTFWQNTSAVNIIWCQICVLYIWVLAAIRVAFITGERRHRRMLLIHFQIVVINAAGLDIYENIRSKWV